MPYPISDFARRSVPRAITDLVLAHAGRPAIVIGGGPSVPWYFVPGLSPALPPDGAIIISANGHGCRAAIAELCPTPDYVVCIDDDQEPVLRPYGVPIVSQRDFCDIQLFRKPVYSSGQLAVYVAWLLGCAPIIPYGMDLYAGGKSAVYFDRPLEHSPGVYCPADQHLDRWRQCRVAIEHDVVRVPAGSPLSIHFPEYRAGESFPDQYADGLRERSAAGYRIRFNRPHPRERGGGHYQTGDELMTTAKVARRLQREKVAVILDDIPERE